MLQCVLVNIFYALKDAYTPLLVGILLLAVRVSIILLLLRLLTGDALVLVIPLTASVIATVSACLLSFILFLRLRKLIKGDTLAQTDQRRYKRKDRSVGVKIRSA